MLINEDVLVVIPAYNEALSVAAVIHEVHLAAPRAAILVVDDASTDTTAAVARAAGAEVVTNVFNLGVGGAMRVGFRYALAGRFRALVQVDGDGQHDANDLPRLVAALDDKPEPAVVIGARFAGEGDYSVPRMRRWAMRLLARYLSGVAHMKLTDVTSGFRAHNRAAIELFARTYPADYLADTVESLVIAVESGGVISQVPVAMRTRLSGTPSQNARRAAMYLARVALMLLIAVFRHRAPRPAGESA
ncbi:MAG: glycosyltransferase family 2 protein [Actinomycetota bacterium]|nr:glycosyltransferase family 2 protein [Actinomycetota bacterium]